MAFGYNQTVCARDKVKLRSVPRLGCGTARVSVAMSLEAKFGTVMSGQPALGAGYRLKIPCTRPESCLGPNMMCSVHGQRQDNVKEP